jgi:putative ABC transport system permease protein
VAAVNETGFNLVGGSDGARQLSGALVTYNLFGVLSSQPMIGTSFSPEEDRPGANQVVLLSFSLWKTQFAGNPAIVGQTIRLNDESYAVKGVMPPGFSFPDKEPNSIDVWVPRAFTPEELTNRRARYLIAIGRLQPRVSLPEANAAIRVVARQNARQYPNEMQGVSGFVAEPLQESYVHDAKPGLLMLMTAVGFILLIACVNVANLLLSRGAGRRREIVLRVALGASTSRIVRQLSVEGALLSAIGGIAGTGVAIGSFAFLKRLIPDDLLHATSLQFSLSVFGFTVLVSLASSFLFGLAPARQTAKVQLNEALREGGRGSSGARHNLGNVFVAAEVALSLVLLVGAGLLLKSFSNLQHVDTGFQPAHVLTLDFDLAEARYHDYARRTRFLETVLQGTRALPGVESAALTGGLPLTSKGGLREEVTPEGSAAAGAPPARAVYRVISPRFFETLRVPLIRGRFFGESDREDAPLVVIVNQKAAQDFWPNQDPIGKRLKFGWPDSGSPWLQVVGVTSDLKQVGLDEPSRDEVYCPYLQSRESWEWPRFLVVRTSGEPLAAQAALRQMAARIDPQEPLNHVMTMSDIVERETSQSEMQTLLLGGLAVLALTMACVGIYGVMAYLVSQRTNEVGIRLALGANRGSILSLVLGQGMKLVLIGVTVGLAAACALTRLINTLLFGVSPFDPLTFVAVPFLLMGVALAACYVPAHRAMRVDPMHALRHE